MKFFPPPHPAMLDDGALLKQCEANFGRASGPGGQHRNKVETAATLTHTPTGLSASMTLALHLDSHLHGLLNVISHPPRTSFRQDEVTVSRTASRINRT